MTRKSLSTLAVALFATISVPAMAGSWPNLPARKAPAKEATAAPAAAKADAGTRTTLASDPFEEIGGDTGWQLKQHKYVFAGGRMAHSDECDHAIRTAAAPTPTEVERLRNASPGA